MAAEGIDCVDYEFLESDPLQERQPRKRTLEVPEEDLLEEMQLESAVKEQTANIKRRRLSNAALLRKSLQAKRLRRAALERSEMEVTISNVLTPMLLKINRIQACVNSIDQRLQNIEENIYQRQFSNFTEIRAIVPWPVADRESLFQLESRLQENEPGVAERLATIYRQNLSMDICVSFRVILRGLLANAGRWTFTGRTPNVASKTTGKQRSDCAAALHSVAILKECAIQKYAISGREMDVIIGTALNKINDAAKKAAAKKDCYILD